MALLNYFLLLPFRAQVLLLTLFYLKCHYLGEEKNPQMLWQKIVLI